VPPAGYAVTIKATSVAATSSFAAGTITIVNQTPSITSITPTPLAPGAFTLTVNGSRFVNGAQVFWNTTALPTTFISSTRLTATGNATQTGGAAITVDNPGPGAVSAAFTVNVVSSVVVTVSPNSAGLTPGATQQFQAAVSGTANTAVTWKVNGTPGGDSSVGTITQTGLYTAPGAIPAAGLATVSAVSKADNLTQGTATVTFQDPLAVTYGRFLDQATFGPTPQLMAHVRQTGIRLSLTNSSRCPNLRGRRSAPRNAQTQSMRSSRTR